jgi:hypothetical protein
VKAVRSLFGRALVRPRTRGYTGELHPGPPRFDVSMQEATVTWLQRVFGQRAWLKWPVCSASSKRLLLCCALPPKVICGKTNQPTNREQYRGKHLRRAVPSFTVEIRRRSGRATTLSPRAPSSVARSPQAEFDRESHRAPAVGFVAKEVHPAPAQVASAPNGRILPSLVRDEPLRRTLRDAAPTPAESAPPSRAPKRPSVRPSQRKDQATKLPQNARVSAHESQPMVEEQLTASRRMSRVHEGAGAQTRAPSQVGGDSRDLALSATAKRIDKIAISRDDVRAKPSPDDQRSTTRTDSPAPLSSRVDGRSPESRKRTIMARYVFGDELKPGERWKRRLLTSR